MEAGSAPLPVIIGTVCLLLVVIVVAPFALCCCFRRKRSRSGSGDGEAPNETRPLLGGDKKSYSGRGTPTSSIQSPTHKANKTQQDPHPVSFEGTSKSQRKPKRGSDKDEASKEPRNDPSSTRETEPIDTSARITLEGDEPNSLVEKVLFVTEQKGTPVAEVQEDVPKLDATPPREHSEDEDQVEVTPNEDQSHSNTEEVKFEEDTSQPEEEVPESPEPPSSPQLDPHSVFSLHDFRPFKSTSYRGIYEEVQHWVEPLVSNPSLHSAYLDYVQPPQTSNKLKDLSKFFQDYGNALCAHKPTPTNTSAPLDPVISALRTEWALQLDEASSLIIVSEALIEFPQHIVKGAVELSSEKRTTLIEFICSTPHGQDQHVYTDEGPFMDPDLQPFMTRMGFSLPQHTKNLVLEVDKEEENDKLTSGLILMEATHVR